MSVALLSLPLSSLTCHSTTNHTCKNWCSEPGGGGSRLHIYTMIHNSKLQLWSSNRIILWLESHQYEEKLY